MRNKKAFTLAEMMVVLLVLSLVMAAFLPVITKKTKTPMGIWQYASNNADAYFGIGATQGISVGTNSLSNSNTRLLINTSSNTQSDMEFRQGNTYYGKLIVDNMGNIGLGGVTLDSTKYGIVVIGTSAQANYASTTAIGAQAQANGVQATAVGYNAIAPISATIVGFGTSSNGGGVAFGTAASASNGDDNHPAVAVGYGAKATAGNVVAIGYNAQAKVGDAIALGTNSYSNSGGGTAVGNGANVAGFRGTALGYYANAGGYESVAIGSYNDGSPSVATTSSGVGSIAIGVGAQSSNTYSLALGYNASASGGHSLVIGENASISGGSSVAIGQSSNVAGNFSVSIGYSSYDDSMAGSAVAIGNGAKVYKDYAIALGSSATASGTYSTAVGNGSQATTNNMATAFGYNSQSSGYGSAAIGPRAIAQSMASTALGIDAVVAVGNDFSTAIGNNAVTNASHQIMIGTSNESVVIPGNLYVQGVHITSDRRLKNITGDFSDGLEKIRRIKPYKYTYKNDKKKEVHVGVMAQDLKKIFPVAVTKGENKYLTIRQEDMFYAMLNSIKQLDKMVQSIVEDIKALILRVQNIEDQIFTLIKSVQINSNAIKQLNDENKHIRAQNKALEIRITRLEKSK